MKQTPRLTTALSCLLLAAGSVKADMIAYDNLGGTADFPFLASDGGRNAPAIDDLQITLGGQLTQVSFAVIADTLGAAVDANIVLAEDNGDGLPDFGAPFSTDTTLLMTTATGLNGPFGFIPTGNATVFDVDVSSANVNLTAGSTIWAEISLTRFGFPADVHTVFYGPIVTGGSDGQVYQRNMDGSVASVTPPDNDTSAGLGWQLHVIPEPASALCILVACGLITPRRRRSTQAS